jgi:hypothetical protein
MNPKLVGDLLECVGFKETYAIKEASEYEDQANAIAKELGLTMTTKYLGLQKPGHWGKDDGEHGTWRVVLSKGGKSYTIPKFYMSIADTEENPQKAPSLYDILATVQKSDPVDFENFCAEFGYDEDSRTAERVFKAVQQEWQGISQLFTPEELEKLQEIA